MFSGLRKFISEIVAALLRTGFRRPTTVVTVFKSRNPVQVVQLVVRMFVKDREG